MKNSHQPSQSRREALRLFAATPLLAVASTSLFANSKAIDLSAHQGKVVLVDFWASWCAPCRKSFPWLNEITEKFAADGLHVIGVNLDENAADAEKFLSKYPANFELRYDPSGELASYYQLVTMPSSLLFSRDGKLLSKHNGFLSSETAKYEATIKNALGI